MISPWDPDNTVDIDEVYVELSLLKDERKPTGTTKQKVEDYSEIFEGRGHNLVPKRIPVYGRPGIGKSTFTKKLAVDWSRGEKEALKKFDVLLLIKLRDVCGTENLCAMLKKAELLSADDPTVFAQLYEYVLRNQQKVLLVLDGCDEYSAEKILTSSSNLERQSIERLLCYCDNTTNKRARVKTTESCSV